MRALTIPLLEGDEAWGEPMTRQHGRVGGTGRRLIAATAIVILVASTMVAMALPVAADTSTATNLPYTCTTNGFGNQAATYSATITDSVDPAAVGQSVTYKFVVPFAQDPPPVTATYQGGTVTYPIPAGLTVTAVSTPPKAGSNLSSTAQVQGGSVVVTTTGSQPVDGGSHPTPDLFVTGTVTSAAAGPGISWKTPSKLVANVDAQFVGQVVATCTPDAPTTVIATTTVPAGPKSPTATNQSIALQQGTSKAITLSATDPDTPLPQLTFAVATQPAHGVLSGTAPNLTYKADATYAGNDSFTFTVRDPQGGTSTGTVSIRVFPSVVIDNTPPAVVITSPSNGAVLTPGQVVKALYSCSDATTGVESCTGSQANGASVSTTTGVHTLTVNAVDTAGNRARESVSYRVIDPTLVKQNFNATNEIPLACNDPLPLQRRTVPATVSAPSQVGTRATLKMRFAPGAGSVPALMSATNITYTLGVPDNGTALVASVVPSTGTANATATASVVVSAGNVVLTIAGPIAGGTTAATSFTPPAVDVTIRAGTTPNTVVQTRLAQYKETDSIGGLGQVPITHTCTAGDPANGLPNPVLTRTTIIDTTPPTVALTAPAKGALYGIGAAVTTRYTCGDETALAMCSGTVANGADIDTSTAGVKTVSVLAVDAAGNTAQQLVSVRVVQTAFTTHYETSEVALLGAAARYLATDQSGFARFAVSLMGWVVSVNGPPSVLPPPPANNGPVAVVTQYSPADAQLVTATAAIFGMTGDQFHRYCASILLYIYLVQVAQPH